METEHNWHRYLTAQELELALSYEREIKRLITDLPKGASEKEQEASVQMQLSIFNDNLMPLKMLAKSRETGIPVEKFVAAKRSLFSSSTTLKMLIALLSVGMIVLSYLYLV